MVDHPLYTMWKERHDAELVVGVARLALKAERQQQQREWQEAWEGYQQRWAAGRVSGPREPWWPRIRRWLAHLQVTLRKRLTWILHVYGAGCHLLLRRARPAGGHVKRWYVARFLARMGAPPRLEPKHRDQPASSVPPGGRGRAS